MCLRFPGIKYINYIQYLINELHSIYLHWIELYKLNVIVIKVKNKLNFIVIKVKNKLNNIVKNKVKYYCIKLISKSSHKQENVYHK